MRETVTSYIDLGLLESNVSVLHKRIRGLWSTGSAVGVMNYVYMAHELCMI